MDLAYQRLLTGAWASQHEQTPRSLVSAASSSPCHPPRVPWHLNLKLISNIRISKRTFRLPIHGSTVVALAAIATAGTATRLQFVG